MIVHSLERTVEFRRSAIMRATRVVVVCSARLWHRLAKSNRVALYADREIAAAAVASVDVGRGMGALWVNLRQRGRSGGGVCCGVVVTPGTKAGHSRRQARSEEFACGFA